ncbi:serine/threonine protein kinase [Limnoglobus roseus]|uniref:non-specific serine/threonine protein kinase n=1 Tax=Limnoglobus roseus TaxID=2598579 RepID=A0A5C1AHF8_9BACT|nr:serine/threonine-protein kinase [Limnoglobus roseus]QEL18260.1 serine/threonine protein kinase [Limnoglobus roseus]
MFVGQKFGPFEIDKELGSGAMGSVYRAKFTHEGKVSRVAIKVVALGLLGNESAMARFEREANILKQLRHPHIVRLVATGRLGKSQPTPFIAMEFVEGESLDHILGRRLKLGWEEVAAYAKQLCSALQYAHEKGIIHRDLKPSNLMVTTEGVLKLTDFGIAKDTDVTALTGANSTIGTAAYMSPEQCRGDKNLTNKSDLYSLGIVLFELITGRKPFVADTTVDMFMKHVQEVPPRASRFVSDLPVWLDNLVAFLMEKDKERRPMDAATVGRMLAEIEEKMQNQQSAGLEVASSRRKDRPLSGNELDEADLEAARSLKAGKSGKKPKKKKKVPLLQRQWVRAIPAVLAVLLIIGGIVYLFMPAGPQALADAVQKANDPEAKIKAAETYLAKYGSDGGDVTQSVRKQLRETRGKQLEAILDKRYASNLAKPADKTEADAYTAAWAGMELEQKGDLTAAQSTWTKLKAREAEIKDDFLEGWGWLADDRLRQLHEVDDKIKALRQQLREMEINEKPWKFDATEPESLAKLAIRLGGSGGVPLISDDPEKNKVKHVSDLPKARRVYADLAKLTEKKPEERSWFLMAVRERGANFDPKADDGKTRADTLPKQLEAIKAEWTRIKDFNEAPAEKRDCRNRCKELIDCYADETDEALKKVVEEAKTLLPTMK